MAAAGAAVSAHIAVTRAAVTEAAPTDIPAEAADQRLRDLASAIHAEPIQRLVAAVVGLDRLRAQLPSDSPGSADIAAGIDSVSADLEGAVALLRRLVDAPLHLDPPPSGPSPEEVREPSADSQRPEAGPPSGHASRTPPTVVVCDDHRDLRGAVIDALADRGGFRVAGQAWDAQTCVDEVLRSRPDLLILDVGLPGGGPGLASAVKAANPTTRIVVFSGHDDDTTKQAMLAAGADSYVVKTGRLRRLIQVLDELS